MKQQVKMKTKGRQTESNKTTQPYNMQHESKRETTVNKKRNTRTVRVKQTKANGKQNEQLNHNQNKRNTTINQKETHRKAKGQLSKAKQT